MAELVKIRGCDRPERRGDVIFVHGLNGNPREYWFPPGEPDKFWPAWVGEDVSDVGVWSLGYENAALKPRQISLVSKLLQRGFAMPLEDRADNVLLRLESDHIGERPLVFITHSMGGLLIKEVLRTANDSPNPRRKAIVEQTRGVCFIATPHIGSDLAKWASYFKTLLGTSVAMAELRPHEPHLRKLNQWYRDFVAPEDRRIKTLSFYEMKPMGRVGLVVAPGDADPGVPHAGLHPLDEDHASICKPGSKNHQIHITVTDFIRRDCLQLDDFQPPSGRSSRRKKPGIPTAPDLNAPNETKTTTNRKRKPHTPRADGPSGETISTEPDPRMNPDSSGESRPSDDHDRSRWETYRRSIRNRLEEVLDGVQDIPVLMRFSRALGIECASSDEDSIKQRIVSYLMEGDDKYAIPTIVRVHEDLCNEGSNRLADRIADCVDLILPLYFSREAISKAWRQLQVQKVALIEGTVATETGAEVVMSHVDGKSPTFLTREKSIPQGKTLVPFESPAIGDPSSEAEVLAILEDLARGAGVVTIDKTRTVSPLKNVAAGTERLRQDLCGWLGPLKHLTGRSAYCALAMPTTPADRENLSRVLKKVRELIPPLVFIELFPESQTREQEMFFIRCLNTRMESERKRKPTGLL